MEGNLINVLNERRLLHLYSIFCRIMQRNGTALKKKKKCSYFQRTLGLHNQAVCFSELVLNACGPLLRSVHIYSLFNPAADAFLAFTNDGDCQIM